MTDGSPHRGARVPPGARTLLVCALVASVALTAGCGAPAVDRATAAPSAPATSPEPAPSSATVPSGTLEGPQASSPPSSGSSAPAPSPTPAPTSPSPPTTSGSAGGGSGGGAASADRDAGVLPGDLPDAGPGTFRVVPGSTPGTGAGRRLSLRVEVEDGLPVDAAAFASFVTGTLTDPRGWSREGWDFVRTDGDADVVLTLASPRTAERMCAPLVTFGTLSCRVGDDVVITAVRWFQGAEAYGEDRTGYRRYLVSHEVGHAIGKGHVGCPGPGAPAPTMMQQSKGVGECAAQPWPYP